MVESDALGQTRPEIFLQRAHIPPLQWHNWKSNNIGLVTKLESYLMVRTAASLKNKTCSLYGDPEEFLNFPIQSNGLIPKLKYFSHKLKVFAAMSVKKLFLS